MEALVEFWPIIFTALGTIVWLVRMEGKVNHLESEMKSFKEDIDNVIELKPLIIQIQNDIKWIKKLIETKFSNKK